MPCAAYETAFETSEGPGAPPGAAGTGGGGVLLIICPLSEGNERKALTLSRPRWYRPSLLHPSFRATLNARIFHDADGMNSGAARFLCMDGR
jgi:hypothetical protein